MRIKVEKSSKVVFRGEASDTVQAGDQPSLFMLVMFGIVAGLGRCHARCRPFE